MKTRLTDSISPSLVYGLWHSLRIPEDGYKNCAKTYSSWRISSVATECLNIRAVPLRCMSTDRFNSSPELESANNSPSNGVVLRYELGLKHELEHGDSSPLTAVNKRGRT